MLRKRAKCSSLLAWANLLGVDFWTVFNKDWIQLESFENK